MNFDGRMLNSKLTQILKKLDLMQNGEGSLNHIQAVLEKLARVFFKEQQMDEIVERFKGFVEYFEDKWAEINEKSKIQNNFISKGKN